MNGHPEILKISTYLFPLCSFINFFIKSLHFLILFKNKSRNLRPKKNLKVRELCELSKLSERFGFFITFLNFSELFGAFLNFSESFVTFLNVSELS